MRHRAATLVAICLALIAFGSAEKPEVKIDVSGTWKWSLQRQNGGGREVTCTLRQDGEKLTGTISGTGASGEIQEGKFKDGEVSFKIVRNRGGTDVVTLYRGKLDGDTLKGKVETEQRGQRIPRDWEAQRVKEETKAKD